MKILEDAGVDFESVEYYIDSIPKSKIKELLKKMGLTARELLQMKEPIYKKLKLAGKNLSEHEIIDLLASYPDLLQRPIVEKGAKAVLAPRRNGFARFS